MHILFLTDNFPPETNAPASRTYEHAREWVRLGHRVTIVTGAPNFPTGRVHEGFRNRWYQVEMVEGIRVVRVKTLITANEGFVLRTLDYLSFMVSGTLGALVQRRFDVVVATSPQFFTAIAGRVVSALRRRPFVLEVRDLWPESIVAVGAMRQSMFIRLMSRVELHLYRSADAIVVVTYSFRDQIHDRGIERSKISVVLNGVLTEAFAVPEAGVTRPELQGVFVVGYLGTHGMAHNLPCVLEAVESMRDDVQIRFLFVGAGAGRAEVERIVRDRRLTNVVLLEAQPRSEIPHLLSQCDVCLVPLRDSPAFAKVIPSKLFECMASGTPVIAALPRGEATEMIERDGVGVVVPPDDPVALAGEIRKLASEPQALSALACNAIKASSLYSRESGALMFIKVLRSVGH